MDIQRGEKGSLQTLSIITRLHFFDSRVEPYSQIEWRVPYPNAKSPLNRLVFNDTQPRLSRSGIGQKFKSMTLAAQLAPDPTKVALGSIHMQNILILLIPSFVMQSCL